jgi:hypothetical protein
MSYGAYNGTRYNWFAWNASWSATLEFPRTASATVAQSEDMLLAVATNAIASSAANTQAAQMLASTVNPIVGASLSASQTAQTFSGIGVVAIGGDASYVQSSSGLGDGAVNVVGVLNAVGTQDTLLADGDTMFKALVSFTQNAQKLNAAASVFVSAVSVTTDDDNRLDFKARLHLLPHATGKALMAHAANTSLTEHSITGHMVRH